jgi:hypothetical protein
MVIDVLEAAPPPAATAPPDRELVFTVPQSVEHSPSFACSSRRGNRDL